MSATPRYKRVIVKLSGEALCDSGAAGVSPQAVEAITAQFAPLLAAGVQVGVVVGAGNFVRGRDLAGAENIRPTTADYMGMLATAMNALALRDALEAAAMPAVVVSAIPMPLICETYFRPNVVASLEAGRVVVFAGGTGHPGVTTDMCAAIRAAELDADILLKATKVDGVFDCDPMTNPDAKKYDRLTYEKAIADRLGVMDLPAMAFCMDHGIPILVFDMAPAGNLAAAAAGETIGTTISE